MSPTPGDWEDLKVYHFSYGWSSFWEGTNLQLSGVPLTWGLGQGAVNMERGGVHDRGEAYFRFINEFHNEDGWTYTDDLGVAFDYDSWVNFTTPNEHTADIVH